MRAQGSILHRRIEQQSSDLLPATLGNISKAPFRAQRQPHRPLLYPFPKSSQPKSHQTRQLGGMGGKGEETILETTNRDAPLPTNNPQLPPGKNPRLGRSLVKQENVRLNRRGNPSTPPAQRPKLGCFLFAQKSMLGNRRQDLAPRAAGRRSRRDRRVGGR